MRNIYKITFSIILTLLILQGEGLKAQTTSEQPDWSKLKKNIIRYSLSSAIFFGVDKTVILGYEHLLKSNQSFSINVGSAALPKFISIGTDSVSFTKDLKNTGFNFSVDYRFYIPNLNVFKAPRGLYFGPYYSLNLWHRNTEWEFKNLKRLTSSEADISLHMAGIEMGYQFLFWKRMTLDMVFIGPGIGFYKVHAKLETNLDSEQRDQLQEAFMQAIQQKFPGFNFVFADKQLDGQGVLRTSSYGFRYLVHLGYNF